VFEFVEITCVYWSTQCILNLHLSICLSW
jgi:hypothetical protein